MPLEDSLLHPQADPSPTMPISDVIRSAPSSFPQSFPNRHSEDAVFIESRTINVPRMIG